MKLLIFGLLIIISNYSLSASFDCKKASTNIEIMICSDASLSQRDDELAKLYKDVLGKSTADQKIDVRKKQRSWLKESRNICLNNDCILSSYSERSSELRAIINAIYKEERKKKRLDITNYYHSLAIDDDPLTGVWSDFTESMNYYTLYEKENEKYNVTFCSPRYSVGTWPGRVEFIDPVVGIWKYEIVNESISMEKTPSLLFNIKGNKLYRFGKDKYPRSYLLTDIDEVASIASCTFKTGEERLKKELATLQHNTSKTSIYSLLEDSESLKKHGDIVSINELYSVQTDFYNYFLYDISLGGPGRSGYCGSSKNSGYYWVKVNVNDSKIVNDWLFVKNSCRSSQYARRLVDENKNTWIFNENEFGDPITDAVCFKLNKNISKYPITCAASEIPKASREFYNIIEAHLSFDTIPNKILVNAKESKVNYAEYELKIDFDLDGNGKVSEGDLRFEAHHVKRLNSEEVLINLKDLDAYLIKIVNDGRSYQIVNRLKLIKEGNSLIFIGHRNDLLNGIKNDTGMNVSVTIENSTYSISGHLPSEGVYKSIAENKVLYSPVKTNDPNFNLKSFQLKIK